MNQHQAIKQKYSGHRNRVGTFPKISPDDLHGEGLKKIYCLFQSGQTTLMVHNIDSTSKIENFRQKANH